MRILFVTLASTMFIACAPRVIHFTNTESDFTSYSTFKLTNFKSDTSLSETGRLLFERIQDQMRFEMNSRNFREVNRQSDLLLRYEVIATSDVEYNVRSRYPYNSLYLQPFNVYDVSRRDLTKSMLFIELLDVKTKKLVWQGSLDLSYTKRSKKEDTWPEESVATIFQTFIYEAGGKTITKTK